MTAANVMIGSSYTEALDLRDSYLLRLLFLMAAEIGGILSNLRMRENPLVNRLIYTGLNVFLLTP
jgi:hypothetical protein